MSCLAIRPISSGPTIGTGTVLAILAILHPRRRGSQASSRFRRIPIGALSSIVAVRGPLPSHFVVECLGVSLYCCDAAVRFLWFENIVYDSAVEREISFLCLVGIRW